MNVTPSLYLFFFTPGTTCTQPGPPVELPQCQIIRPGFKYYLIYFKNSVVYFNLPEGLGWQFSQRFSIGSIVPAGKQN
jgi:hypothetical protein